MSFHARETFTPEMLSDPASLSIPGRVYVHSAGLREVYEGDPDNAVEHFINVAWPRAIEARRRGEFPLDAAYFLAIIWGKPDTQSPMTDLFMFRDFGSTWPGNPEVLASVMERGRIIYPSSIGCGDGLIMLGAEERLRRTKPNLQTYLESEVPVSELPWQQL